MKILPSIYFALLGILLSGCSQKFIVNVDSLSSPIAKEKTKYILVPGNKDCSRSDLQYMEFESYTDRALQDLGFFKASDNDQAEVLIILSYGITDPLVYNYTYEVPIYGQTGISSSHTSGNVYSFSNGASYSANTSYTPSYGVIGSKTCIGTGVSYKRYLSLIGMDVDHYKLTNEVKDLWHTDISSVGESGDLRKVFPILLGAAKEHIASNTGQKIIITLSEKDNRVLEVKGELKQKQSHITPNEVLEKTKCFFSDLKTKISSTIKY